MEISRFYVNRSEYGSLGIQGDIRLYFRILLFFLAKKVEKFNYRLRFHRLVNYIWSKLFPTIFPTDVFTLFGRMYVNNKRQCLVFFTKIIIAFPKIFNTNKNNFPLYRLKYEYPIIVSLISCCHVM